MKEIMIRTEYITLGQLLKITGIAHTGGMAKMLLEELVIYVNDEVENRRGKKLYNNDIIKIDSHGIYKIIK